MNWTKNGNLETIHDVFLRNIGVSSTDEVNGWFKKHYDHDYHIADMDKAIRLIMEYKNLPIRIVGDYDVDGITSTSILMLGLRWAGCKDVGFRIPKRFSEGFGINKTIIDEIDPRALIITCDNGLAQNEAIAYAKDKGFTIIIVDHHLPETIGEESVGSLADIVIDPSAYPDTADFTKYCGAGLCYKLMEKLLEYDKTKCAKLMSLAAIGTIGDVMELNGENYVLVRNGLKYLQNAHTTVPGAYSLIDKCNLLGHMTAHDIAFLIAPIINSCSRMADDGAKRGVELLTCELTYDHVDRLANNLINTNDLRKKAKNEAMITVNEIIKETHIEKDVPLIIFVPDLPEGIVGIIAGSLASEHKVPAIVLTNTENGLLKGSARTYGNYNIKENLDKVAKYLEKYGGHVEAAGLSLKEENYDVFKKEIQENSKGYIYNEPDTLMYDIEIDSSQVGAMLKELQKYEPFGNGNNMPVFKITNYKTNNVKLIGSDQSTVKFNADNCDAIGFGQAEKLKKENNSNIYQFIGTLSYNYWGKTVSQQIEFIDMKSAE